MGYKKKALEGIGWLTLLRIVSQGTILLKLSILARLLTPASFGVFAIVTTALNTFETLSDTGFNYAAIQQNLEIKKIARTLLFINILRGALLSLLVIVASYAIAAFFTSEGLLSLLIIGSVIPLLRGFINPHTISFQKDLQFDKELIFRFVPILANTLLTLLFVFYYHSVFGLMFGLIASTVVEVLFSYCIASRDFASPIQKHYIKSLFSFGKWITAGGFVTYFSTQIDNLFVGKFLGSFALGLYDFSYRTANLAFTEITNTLSQVAFPIYSKTQGDKTHLLGLFKKNIIAVCIPAALLSLPFILAPRIVLTTLFGSQWAGAASTLQILAVLGFMRAVIGPVGPLFLAAGKPKLLTRISFINFFITILILYPFSHFFGLEGVALAMTFSYGMVVPIYMFHTYRLFNHNEGNTIRNL